MNSALIGTFKGSFDEFGTYSVKAFGAVGDGITDDTAAIQAAIDAAILVGGIVKFTPGSTYKTTAELLIGVGKTIVLEGGTEYDTTISCISPARSVLACVGNAFRATGLGFYANRETNYGVYLENASQTYLNHCMTYQPLVDGFHLHVDCDGVRLDNCLAQLSGKIYHTAGYAGPSPANIKTLVVGTVSKTSGASCIITRDSGTLDFTTLGIRAGDMISTHPTAPGDASAEWLSISSVDSATQITCVSVPVSSGAAAGLQFSIHVGNGYHEGPGRADVNINQLDKFLARNNACFGVRVNGLYGLSSTNLQSDANGAYPVGVGTAGVATIGCSFVRSYFENNGAANNFFLGYAADVIIDSVNGTGQPVVSNPSYVWGVIRGMQNAGDPGRIDPLGGSIDYVPSGALMADVYAKGRILGQNYAQNSTGTSSLTMRDSLASAWTAVSGSGAGGQDSNTVGYNFDTNLALTTGNLFKWKNHGTDLITADYLGNLSAKSLNTPTMFNVKAFGAKGDGTTNDYAAIQAAITAADAAGGTVYLPAGTYRVDTELLANSPRKVTIQGDGTSSMVIRAGAAITSVLGLTGAFTVCDLTLNANALAQYAGRGAGSVSESIFRRVTFTNAKNDGWHFNAVGISDNNSFYDCVWEVNGTIFRTSGRGAIGGSAIETVTPGTVATNGLTVTGTGTQFNSMGIRRGDFIAVGVSPLTEYLQIASVDSDTVITLEATSASVVVRSGQEFAIGVGDGHHENYGAADNNINRFFGGRVRSAAGCGMVFGGLYGPQVTGIQIDVCNNGYAIAVGNGMLNPVYGANFNSVYIESCAAGGFYLGYAAGITITGTMDTSLSAPRYDGQVTTGTPPRWRAPDSARVFGVWMGSSYYSYAGASQVDPIGGGFSNIPVTTTSASRFTINGPLRHLAVLTSCAAGTPITPGGSAFAYMSVAGDVLMTATPSITQTNYGTGDIIYMSVSGAANSLTFQDESVLAGSKIHLGGRQRLRLNSDNTAVWWFSPSGYWSLVATDGILYDVADSTGIPGAATQNTLSGRVSIAAGVANVVVTNSKITTTSKVFAVLQSADSTLTMIQCVVPAAGSFTIQGNANATATTNIAWKLEQ